MITKYSVVYCDMNYKPQCLISLPSSALQLLGFKKHVTYFRLGDGWIADVHQFWILLQKVEDPWEGLVLELTHNLFPVVWILKIGTPNSFFLLLVFENIGLNKYKY